MTGSPTVPKSAAVAAVTSTPPTFAIRTGIADPALQAYIQQHPFLTGPDADANQRALQAVRRGLRVSRSAGGAPIERRPDAELRLPPTQDEAAAALLRAAGLGAAEVEHARRDYSWRAAAVPVDARSILCLGSGEGHELAFLRARAPLARIVVLDYVAKLRPGLLKAVGAEFTECDLVAALPSHEAVHDVVFSNHTLEHMFEPDLVLTLIARCLRPGGCLVAGLPLDGDPSTPLHRQVVSMAARAASLNALDLGVFDAGHPWKTNAADLTEALERAGFVGIAIVQRSDIPFRAPAVGAATQGPWPRSALEAANRAVFGLVRLALRVVLPSPPPYLCRALVAVERRLPFGANRLKNSHSPDVVVRAARQPCAEGKAAPMAPPRRPSPTS